MASGEYKNISFIHEIAGRTVEDVTEEILSEAHRFANTRDRSQTSALTQH